MIRFIDMTRDYFCFGDFSAMSTLSPTCAFADTIIDKFLSDSVGCQVFFSREDVADIPGMADRCLGLIPEGFFDLKSEYWKERMWLNQD